MAVPEEAQEAFLAVVRALSSIWTPSTSSELCSAKEVCLVAEAGIGKQVEREVRPVRDLFGAADVAISGLGYYPNALAPDAAEAKVA